MPELTVSYGYDDLSQLITVDRRRFRGPISRTEYTYDAVGNRLTRAEFLRAQGDRKLGAGSVDYAYDPADRLVQAGNTSFTYDANGNRLSETTVAGRAIEYAYDAADRLIHVLQDEGRVVYAYDGHGNKVERANMADHAVGQSDSADILRFVNDLSAPLPVVLEEHRIQRGRPEDTVSYLYGLGLISEQLPDVKLDPEPQVFFYHSDGLGSTITLTGPSGAPQAQHRYDAWGNLLIHRSNSKECPASPVRWSRFGPQKMLDK